MKRTVFQHPELRDANNNIIQQGAFGKNTALANSTNDGWIDYVANDLEALYNNTMGGTGGEINTETITGKTGTITNLTATTVKAGTLTADALNGPLTGNVTGTADKAIADGNGNNIVNTYVTKSAVQGELTNYLPLSGGTMRGTITTTANPGLNVRGNNSYLVLCGASSYDQGAHILLFGKNGSNNEGAFSIVANNGSGGYFLLAGKPDGTLTWDRNNILTAANYNSYALPLSGGTLTGAINTANKTWNKLGDDASFGDHDIGGKMCVKSQTFRNTGIAFFDQTDKNVGVVDVNNAFDFNKPVKENGGFLVPIGVVQAFAGSTIPTGWLLCDGSAVSRTGYAALFAVIGTTYGTGDGSTTFNLPNLVDKFIQGNATSGTKKTAGLPNITGSIGGGTGAGGPAGNGSGIGFLRDTMINGCFQPNTYGYGNESGQGGGTVPSGYPVLTANFDASRSSDVYGNSTTVQPPALTMRYIIKY